MNYGYQGEINKAKSVTNGKDYYRKAVYSITIGIKASIITAR